MCVPEHLAISVSVIATAISQGRTIDELELMSAVFMQIGDTLTTIATSRGICENSEKSAEPAQEKS